MLNELKTTNDEELYEGESINQDVDDALITCDSLVKIFKTDEIEVMALQGLDMVIKRGEFLSVIGKSGSGKSTLMNIIGGLEKPSAGRIVVEGKNLSEFSEKEMIRYRKETVGFVWQKSSRNLFGYLTATENIEAAMNFTKRSHKQRHEKALELLDMVGMSHKANSYPGQMSGGEQQRIAIAVALANDPQILLADEPTGAVDSKTSAYIQDLFRKLNRELHVTVIIVTHDMKLADKTDRVVMISDGKISTEKIMKEQYKSKFDAMEDDYDTDVHEVYSIMDKAHRVQLSNEMLKAAGIDSNKVKITMEDGKLIIVGENSNH